MNRSRPAGSTRSALAIDQENQLGVDRPAGHIKGSKTPGPSKSNAGGAGAGGAGGAIKRAQTARVETRHGKRPEVIGENEGGGEIAPQRLFKEAIAPKTEGTSKKSALRDITNKTPHPQRSIHFDGPQKKAAGAPGTAGPADAGGKSVKRNNANAPKTPRLLIAPDDESTPIAVDPTSLKTPSPSLSRRAMKFHVSPSPMVMGEGGQVEGQVEGHVEQEEDLDMEIEYMPPTAINEPYEPPHEWPDYAKYKDMNLPSLISSIRPVYSDDEDSEYEEVEDVEGGGKVWRKVVRPRTWEPAYKEGRDEDGKVLLDKVGWSWEDSTQEITKGASQAPVKGQGLAPSSSATNAATKANTSTQGQKAPASAGLTKASTSATSRAPGQPIRAGGGTTSSRVAGKPSVLSSNRSGGPTFPRVVGKAIDAAPGTKTSTAPASSIARGAARHGGVGQARQASRPVVPSGPGRLRAGVTRTDRPVHPQIKRNNAVPMKQDPASNAKPIKDAGAGPAPKDEDEETLLVHSLSSDFGKIGGMSLDEFEKVQKEELDGLCGEFEGFEI